MNKVTPFFYGWWVVLSLLIISGLSIALVISTFNIYLNAVSIALTISKVQFALCVTIINLIIVVFSPLIGKKLQDNTQLVMLICLIGFSLSYMSYAFAQSLTFLYINSAIFGLCSIGLTGVPIAVLINRWFVTNKGLALSLALSGSAIWGMVLSPYITNAIQNDQHGFAYQSIGLMTLIIGVIFIGLVIKNSPTDKGLQPYNKKMSSSQFKHLPREPLVSLTVNELKTKKFHWKLLIGQYLIGFVGGGIVMQLPVFLQNIYGLETSAYFLMITLGIMIFSKILLGSIYDKLGVIFGTSIVASCVILSCICFLFSSSPLGYVFGLIGMIIWGMGNCIGTVTPTFVASHIYDQRFYGTIYGNFNRFQTLGTASGVPFISYFYATTQSYSIVWLTLITLTIIMLVLYISGYKESLKYREENVSKLDNVTSKNSLTETKSA